MSNSRLILVVGAIVNVAVAGLVALPGRTAPKPPPSYPYRCISLGTLGGDYSSAHGVNETGEVVGYSNTVPGIPMNGNHDERAFYWKDRNADGISDPGEMTFLGDLGYNSVARSINNSGEIVGFSRTANGDHTTQRAVLWNGRTDPPTMTDLNDLLSPQDQTQWVLNNAIQIDDYRRVLVQGVLRADGNGARTFLLDLTTTPATLTDLGANLAARGMNGFLPPLVVGNPNNSPVLFDASNSTTTVLSPLSAAYSVSDAREVVGQVKTASGYRHPAYWKDTNGNGLIDGNETVVDLGVFDPSAAETSAGLSHAVNTSGVVVGNTAAAKKVQGYAVWAAFRWQAGSPPSTKQDLNSLTAAPFKLRAATDISNSGLIVGWGNPQNVIFSESSLDKAYLLKPNY